jgi:UDP-N-acetylmuramoyl-tripeptide--D-alanyl-D-alanine ligase
MSLWTLEEVVSATNAEARNVRALSFSGVAIDSREVEKDTLFIAIKGDRLDGHDFVAQAVASGAGAAIVSREKATELANDLPLVIVDEPLSAMEDLGRAARARTDAKIIAVTGSVGKTSTKEAIRHVLEKAGRTHASIRSFNNHWGVPLMLARMPRETQFGVFEVGMNHADEIRPLTKMIRPHIAVVTNVGPVHLENFADVHGIAAAKAEIFDGLEPGGMALVGADHDYVADLEKAAQAAGIQQFLRFGKNAASDYQLHNVTLEGRGLNVQLKLKNGDLNVKIPQLGQHAAANGLCAAAIAELLDIDAQTIAKGLENFQAPVGRGAITVHPVAGGTVTLIDESYNANPISMRAALAILKSMPKTGKKIAVLGDMLELGSKSAEFHAELSAPIRDAQIDKVFAVGTEMAHLCDALSDEVPTLHFTNRENVANKIIDGLANGDIVMFKGSNGIGLGAVVSDIKAALGQL